MSILLLFSCCNKEGYKFIKAFTTIKIKANKIFPLIILITINMVTKQNPIKWFISANVISFRNSFNCLFSILFFSFRLGLKNLKKVFFTIHLKTPSPILLLTVLLFNKFRFESFS